MSIDTPTWILIYFNAVLAIASIVLAWATWRLARYTEGLTRRTGQLVEIEQQREERLDLEKYRIRVALLDELQTNHSLIQLKKNIINQILAVLDENKLLPGSGAHAATIVYDSLISTIYTSLDRNQRDNLHVIYQHLKHNDSLMDTFERDFKMDLKTGNIKHPWESPSAWKIKLQDVLNDYTAIQDLIQRYLVGEPLEVFPPVNIE